VNDNPIPGTVDAQSTKPETQVIRLSSFKAEALVVLQEYYDAVSVVRRDSPRDIQKLIDDSGSGVWLAYRQDVVAGCVVMRPVPSIPDAGECKRLYVRAEHRGHGIADALMDALEEFAKSIGLRWVYLDTYDDLTAAIALYRRRGYRSCVRFNDNPQATMFFRKILT
jgi:ribosomal protein S18 acetylase RimI-like enzyme